MTRTTIQAISNPEVFSCWHLSPNFAKSVTLLIHHFTVINRVILVVFQKALAFLTAMIVVSGFVILLVSSGVSHAQAGWQQWEYLLIEYTRNDVSIFDEDNPPLEYIQTSTEPYASDFQYILTGGCEDLQVESTAELIARLENEFAEMSNEERQSIIEVHEGLRQMEEIIQENECLARNYRGLTYYLSILGNDGWELVQVINRSDLNTYQIEMFFKRLKL